MIEYNLHLGGGSLIQVANRTLMQMMSYIIDTPKGGVIVIDGGSYSKEDAECLYDFLAKRGKKVDRWFMTHAHDDHLGALTLLMENMNFDIEIGKMCFHFPASEWLAKKEDNSITTKFLQLLNDYNINVVTVCADEIYSCDGIDIEVLSVPEDYEEYPNINSTSLILKVKFPKKDVLFLGDFDVFAQDEFLRKHEAKKLRCDIVQMAHHVQNGVDKSFYELIAPRFCMYPTPKWLWENNFYEHMEPETAGKGPFSTLVTRQWMQELGVVESFTQINGDILFR